MLIHPRAGVLGGPVAVKQEVEKKVHVRERWLRKTALGPVQLRPSCDSPFVPVRFFLSPAALLMPLNLHPACEPN